MNRVTHSYRIITVPAGIPAGFTMKNVVGQTIDATQLAAKLLLPKTATSSQIESRLKQAGIEYERVGSTVYGQLGGNGTCNTQDRIARPA